MRSYYDLCSSANSDDEEVKLKKSVRWNLALFGAFFLEFIVAILDVISRFTPYGLFRMSEKTYHKWFVMNELVCLNVAREAAYPWVELLVNSCWLIVGLMAHDGLAKKKRRLESLHSVSRERKDQLPGDHPDLSTSVEESPLTEKDLEKRILKVDQNLHLVKIKSWREIIDWHISLYACFRNSSGTSIMEPIVGTIGVLHGILGLYRLSLKYTLDDNWLHSES